jgi:hypothetical protein
MGFFLESCAKKKTHCETLLTKISNFEVSNQSCSVLNGFYLFISNLIEKLSNNEISYFAIEEDPIISPMHFTISIWIILPFCSVISKFGILQCFCFYKRQ